MCACQLQTTILTNDSSEELVATIVYLGFAHRRFMPKQDVVWVGYFANKLLTKALSIDGGEASVIHLHYHRFL